MLKAMTATLLCSGRGPPWGTPFGVSEGITYIKRKASKVKESRQFNLHFCFLKTDWTLKVLRTLGNLKNEPKKVAALQSG